MLTVKASSPQNPTEFQLELAANVIHYFRAVSIEGYYLIYIIFYGKHSYRIIESAEWVAALESSRNRAVTVTKLLKLVAEVGIWCKDNDEMNQLTTLCRAILTKRKRRYYSKGEEGKHKNTQHAKKHIENNE